jgi:NADH-quinone oxidoreductase subunit E
VSLSTDVQRQIEALRPKYPTGRALLLPALHMVQKENGGWLPELALLALAEYLALPPSDVMGVVTFYDMYHERPVGRHRIRVCTNLSCMLRGSEEIMEALAGELGVEEGVVTADGRCSFVHFECLGSCDTAPMMMVDDDYHENLTPESAARIARELK